MTYTSTTKSSNDTKHYISNIFTLYYKNKKKKFGVGGGRCVNCDFNLSHKESR